MFHGSHRYSFLAHSHEVITVIQVTRGAVEIEVDSRRHAVRGGDLVLIGADQVHSARPLGADGWSMRSLHLPAQFFRDFGLADADVGFACPVYPGSTRDHAAFGEWHAACEAGNPARAQESYARFERWLHGSLGAFAPFTTLPAAADERIERARTILDGDICDNRSLDDVARQVGISSFALIRGFTKTFGLPPHTWRMQARARAAALRLSRHEELAQVAPSCGFVDQSHLARVFKRVFGVTPGQYRSMH
jgi:AraC-like DNA-binding protein